MWAFHMQYSIKPALILSAICGVETPAFLRTEFFRELCRLRKKTGFQAKCPKSMPQGLKPSLIPLALYRG
jgi:hypothetical protein